MENQIKYQTTAVFLWEDQYGENFVSPASRDDMNTFKGGYSDRSTLSGGNWRTKKWEKVCFEGRIIPSNDPERIGTIVGVVKDGETGYGLWSKIFERDKDISCYIPNWY